VSTSHPQTLPPLATTRPQWWLANGDGVRRRVDAGGVLIGRAPRCDLVLRDPKASRSQALVYLDGDEPHLLVLGKGRTRLNGAVAGRETRLAAGDRVSVPGLELELVSSADQADARDGQAWVLDRPGGGLFGVSYGPFVIGGHASDDLQLIGWPDHALTLHPTQGRLHLATQVALEVDGIALDPSGLMALLPGSSIVYAGHTLRVVAGGQFGQGSTLTDSGGATALPDRIDLEFLPRGGRLRVHTAGGECCVYLPGQRCDLMALLLRPPDPYRRGEFLDDELLLPRVWPNQLRTRIDLNTLIYRLRRDLVRAGIDATALIVRAPGGGGTRLGVGDEVAICIG
jgi:hypothetical protein